MYENSEEKDSVIVDMRRKKKNVTELIKTLSRIIVVNAEYMTLADFSELLDSIHDAEKKLSCEFRGAPSLTEEGEWPFLFFAQHDVLKKGYKRGVSVPFFLNILLF